MNKLKQMILGTLHKMNSQFSDPVQYELVLGETNLSVNSYLNKNISLEITGNIFCIHCGRKTQKSFQQGFCFPCLRRLQECNLCIIHPERCLVETGKCDPKDWAHVQCNEPHIVYLANASALKVGITREKNIPYRWIDQGAMQGLPMFKTTQRALAGKVEVAFKQYVADKTNWREMLKNNATLIDLISWREDLCKKAKKDLEILDTQYPGQIIRLNETQVTEIRYPVLEYPTKIVSLSFDKTPKITGKLLGIKGQYLIFDIGVINIRKYGGYEVHFSSD